MNDFACVKILVAAYSLYVCVLIETIFITFMLRPSGIQSENFTDSVYIFMRVGSRFFAPIQSLLQRKLT